MREVGRREEDRPLAAGDALAQQAGGAEDEVDAKAGGFGLEGTRSLRERRAQAAGGKHGDRARRPRCGLGAGDMGYDSRGKDHLALGKKSCSPPIL